MFRSRRRAALARRLNRARVAHEEAAASEADAVLSLLSERQLELFLQAVESGGGRDCVLVPRESNLLLHCLRLWRWQDLEGDEKLRRLPFCKAAIDPRYECCHPFHWSRIYYVEFPPPPYRRFAKERLKPEDRAPSEKKFYPGSLTTNGEGAPGTEWCKLAYWELGCRVGRLYPVHRAVVNVHNTLPLSLSEESLCLDTLAAASPCQQESVQRTRPKIGKGITLSQEEDGVWAYNRSKGPIFVNSPTLDDPESRAPVVYRVPSGFCLNIYERGRTAVTGWAEGPVDPNSVRISFAKGWGPKYSRQEVTSCPCWLEVLLAPCR